MTLDYQGRLGLGNTSPAASSIIDLTSTTKGALLPRMTTTQRDAIASPATGLTVYNTTTNTNDTYLGGAWVNDLQSASPSFTGLLSGVGTTQTGSSAVGVVDLSQTWNTTGNVTGIKYNAIITASGASSKLMDLQVGGSSKFYVDKNGNTTLGGNGWFQSNYADVIQYIMVNKITSRNAGTNLVLQDNGANILINTSTNVPSSILTVESTTKGFLPPRMTTTQRTAIATPAEGLTVYDLTLHKLYVYDGTIWQAAW
jgi:hypothetical protein